MTEYWQEYYRFWDDFVREWFENEGSFQGEIGSLYGDPKLLDVKELPEPYVHRPFDGKDRRRVKAAILNLNPGASSGNECTKCLCRYREGDAELMYKFDKVYKRIYSHFVSECGCLLNGYKKGWHNRIPGVHWWQGDKRANHCGGRMRWLRQFYGSNLMPEEVFASELCPYHSKRTRTGAFEKKICSNPNVVWERVLAPLAVVVAENRLPCVSCVGKVFESILGNQFKDDFQQVNKWFKGKDEHGNVISKWPDRKKDELLIVRSYTLYRLKADSQRSKELSLKTKVDLSMVCFLCITSQGSNNPPQDKFQDVEKNIRSYIEGLCC